MIKNKTLQQGLTEYIPEPAIEHVVAWFNRHHVILRISRSRLTKLGDFRGGPKNSPSYISVNHNLNKYSFLITLLHEMAHAEVHENYSRRVPPHGKVWKVSYNRLAMPYATSTIFPENIRNVYVRYLANPLASSSSCIPLLEALRLYDTDKTNEVIVSMLAPESLFETTRGKVFRMVGKLRKRYRCYCLDNKKTYLFSPLAVIKPIEKNEPGATD